MMLEPQYDFVVLDSNNPIDTLEAIAQENKWPLEKVSEDEASLECTGRWGQFTLDFMWQEEFQALQFAAESQLVVTDEKMAVIKELLFDINHQVWIGHFDLTHDNHVMFRYTSLMRGSASNGQDHIEDLIELAMTEFDRFYPAFKAVLSERKIANDIMLTMLADPAGEA